MIALQMQSCIYNTIVIVLTTSMTGKDMDAIIKYIKDALGVEIKVNALKPDKLNGLPMFIAALYDLKLTRLFNHDIILVFVKSQYTTDSLRKHLEIIRNTFNTNAVAVIDQLESYNRLRLVERKVPFIIPGKQMYLPDLLVDLKEYGIRPKNQPQSMQPATQLLLLYHLQIENLEGYNLKEIAGKIHYDGATITRAAFYLHNMDICDLRGSKEKSMQFSLSGKELWDKVAPLMSNPVKTTQYYSGWIKDDNLFKSNINALSHYSDLNDDVVEYYAARPGYLKFIGPVDPKKTGPLEGNLCVEEWKYNPHLLTKTKFVDPLSLYLCFRGKPDERIESALDQIIEKIEW